MDATTEIMDKSNFTSIDPDASLQAYKVKDNAVAPLPFTKTQLFEDNDEYRNYTDRKQSANQIVNQKSVFYNKVATDEKLTLIEVKNAMEYLEDVQTPREGTEFQKSENCIKIVLGAAITLQNSKLIKKMIGLLPSKIVIFECEHVFPESNCQFPPMAKDLVDMYF